MGFINAKRKRSEDTHGDKNLNRSHKQHQSSIDYEAHPTSEPKQSLAAEAPNSSADEASPLSLKKTKAKYGNASKPSPVQRAAKQQEASGKASGSSADKAPAVKPAMAEPSKRISKKLKVSSSAISSLGEGCIADPSDGDADAASEGALVAALTSPSEDGSEDEDEEDEEDEDKDKDGDEDENEESSSSRDRRLSGHRFSSDEDEGEELEPEDDETGPARLKAKVQAQARLEKKGLVPGPESGTSSESSMEWASDAVSNSDGEPHPNNKKKETFKADDPNAFAASMHGILGYKLTRTQRANPILARSADAKEADEALLDLKLEKKAKAEMRREKVEKEGRGMQTDAMLRGIHVKGAGDTVDSTFSNNDGEEVGPVAAYQQREKELRKMAQRGVVKMFNAFAHVSEKAVEAQGMVGSKAKKEEKVTKMTKEGWLEHIGLGGK